MEYIAQALKSKTVLFGIALAVLSALQGNLQLLNLDATGQMYAGMAISAAIIVLRAVTSQPLSEK